MKRPDYIPENLFYKLYYLLMWCPYILFFIGIGLIAKTDHDYIGFAILVLGIFISVYHRRLK